MDDAHHQLTGLHEHLQNKIRSYIRNAPTRRFQTEIDNLIAAQVANDLVERVQRYLTSLQELIDETPWFDIAKGVDRYCLVLNKIEEVYEENQRRIDMAEIEIARAKRARQDAADEESRRLNRLRDEREATARAEKAKELLNLCPSLV